MMEEKPTLEQLIAEEEASTRRSWYEWADALVVALMVVAIISACFFRVVGVSGSSMADTLHHGDSLLMTSGFYSEPTYGDIVVVNRDGSEPIIKRVIALEGDTVRIDEETGKVYLNDQLLDEPYLLEDSTPILYDFPGTYTVPKDCVFVLGDNRKNSHDSRDLKAIGAVHKDEIMGKAIFRVWPPAGFGAVG